MTQRDLVLVELPHDVPPTITQIDHSLLTSINTLEELEKVCSRLTDTVEEDLKKRLLVYREERDRWLAEPKFKRIYKYREVARKDTPKTAAAPDRTKFRSLKQKK